VFVTARTTDAHAYLPVPPERNLGRYQWLLECSSVAFSLLDASWEVEGSPLDCERQAVPAHRKPMS
jgi:hypothetical protein